MKELQTLDRWMEELRHELNALQERKKSLAYLMSLKGYSIKEINGNRYLYVWKSLGNGKKAWRSLGNIKNFGGEAGARAIRDEKVRVLFEEYQRLQAKEDRIKELVRAVIGLLEDSLPKLEEAVA